VATEESIYSTVPTTPYSENPDEEQRNKILCFLKQKPGAFFKARIIAINCDLSTHGTQVEVRRLITQLIEIDKRSVMSNHLGFSYVTQSRQMRFYAEQLYERKQGLQRRIDVVNEIATIMERESK